MIGSFGQRTSPVGQGPSSSAIEARQSKSLKVSLPIVGTNVRQFVVDPFQREMRQKPLLQQTKTSTASSNSPPSAQLTTNGR